MVRDGYSSITLDEDTLRRLYRVQKKYRHSTIPETIRALIQEKESGSMEEINHKIEMLLQLVESDRNPFIYAMLEIGATKNQIEAVFDLMDKTEKEVTSSKKPTHNEFEKEIYRIFPHQKGNYHLAEGIVGMLGKEGRWKSVYDYMKKDGMNPANM